jgi:hypothetical protein
MVTYADGTTPVLPGDRVSVRFFLRRRPGEIIYVPGISKRRSTYEHSGLTWVGVSLPDGWAVGEIVLPETGRLKKSVRFVSRGSESLEAADALRRHDEEEAASPEGPEGLEREEADEPTNAEAVAPPRPMDWFAGIVAIALHLGGILLVIALFVAAVVFLRRLF